MTVYVESKARHRYWSEEQEGRKAEPGTRCPYGLSHLGARCAWLAGHYDTHGLGAWEIARSFEDYKNKE